MLAVPERGDHVVGMTRSIGRDKDGFDVIVFDHLFERGIFFAALRLLGKPFAPVGEEIGDGDNFDIRMVLKVELAGKLAKPETGKPDADFAVGIHFPDFGSIGFDKLFKPFDLVQFPGTEGAET